MFFLTLKNLNKSVSCKKKQPPKKHLLGVVFFTLRLYTTIFTTFIQNNLLKCGILYTLKKHRQNGW